MKLKFSLVVSFLFLMVFAFGQIKEAPENWFNLDGKADGVMGVSSEKSYKELLKGKKSTTVIVAVIDGGVDDQHEDLKSVMWVNEDEKPGNGIDDDGNGYIDDIHGWNFMGNRKGENVDHDQLEITRLYVKYGKKYKNADINKLSKKEKKEYKFYKHIEKIIMDKRSEMEGNYAMYSGLFDGVEKLQKKFGDDFTVDDLKDFEPDDPILAQTVTILTGVLGGGGTVEKFKKRLNRAKDYFNDNVEYMYNPDFDPRYIVGDNYSDSYEKGYGNNDVKGPDASHGTHVAGIIAADRNNDLGMKGVANDVKIMGVRAVPNGDERDKDVANAIIYAVDNGASIINMSFGKSYSWDKKAVDKAVKYAVKHDVLLVHAAGNDSNNTDEKDNFPRDQYEKKGFCKAKKAKTWIEVGALSWEPGDEAIADFSNYAVVNVDIFAPGVDIYSTTPDDTYDSYGGTSMASPVVAGVAALVRSYYPELTAKQVKSILLASAVPVTQKVKRPGDNKLVTMKELCVTGGVVNAYNALQLAAKTKGKKKVKKTKA